MQHFIHFRTSAINSLNFQQKHCPQSCLALFSELIAILSKYLDKNIL